ncbi:MAG: hypothetical protein KC422_17060 [Trueperaceae bacterium]|nr:hypothetical protein [Trueperaceae bacterium]
MNFEPGEINIICTHLTASRHFYEEILGFEFIEEEQGAVRLSCKQQNFLLYKRSLYFSSFAKGYDD